VIDIDLSHALKILEMPAGVVESFGGVVYVRVEERNGSSWIERAYEIEMQGWS